MASDWLAALLTANQELHLKILVGYPCFYPRIALVALTPGGEFLCENIIYFASSIISHHLDGTGKGYLLGRQGHISPTLSSCWCQKPGSCFSNVSQALQNNIARNHIYSENLKVKLCTCAQSMALGLHTQFQLEIIISSTISAICKFRDNILDSSGNVSETPRHLVLLE